MQGAWGRPPRNDLWKDLQALAIWILIIGVVGYVVFPNFFKDIYSKLADPVAQTSTLEDNYSLSNSNTLNTNANATNQQNLFGQNSASVSDALYTNGNNEVSSGYWIIFVSEGAFKQLSVSSDNYAFLLRLIETDQSVEGKNAVMLTENGQIKKYNVSAEISAIIENMALVVGRAKT